MRTYFFYVIAVTLPVASTADSVTIHFDSVRPQVIQQRLEDVPSGVEPRKAKLTALFEENGCRVSEEPVKHSKFPNLICTLDGEGDSAIVVGGHYDYIAKGQGAVDDWSGAVLLPSLYQSLKTTPRHHRFVFVAFAAEEEGLLGSKEYVAKLPPDQRPAIHAMIYLECLGLSPPKVWATRADKRLLSAFVQAAQAIHVDPAASNVEQVGDDDSHPFLNAKIPVLTIHSITQETLRVLHSPADNLKAIHPDDYYASYRLTAALLSLIDSTLE